MAQHSIEREGGKRENKFQIKEEKKTNFLLRHPKIWVPFFWSLVNMHELNGILYALGAKNLITLFPQRLETVTVRISMENLGSSLNSRLSTTGWKERKVKKTKSKKKRQKVKKRQKDKKTVNKKKIDHLWIPDF